MRKLILFSVIQQLLYHIATIESLMGSNLTPILYGEFPFVASFKYFPEEENFCGGALIAIKHVLTTAYCLRNLTSQRFRIVFEVGRLQEDAVSYTADSWMTFNHWADGQDSEFDEAYRYSVAIVTLTDRVHHINPVALNELTRSQLYGTEAKMIGWRNAVLSKATVRLLNNEDCERRANVLRTEAAFLNDLSVLCSAGNPYALLNLGDIGSPLIHARDKSLVGIAFASCPGDGHVQGNFPMEFIRQHQVNIHYNVDYYRDFIDSVVPAATSPAA